MSRKKDYFRTAIPTGSKSHADSTVHNHQLHLCTNMELCSYVSVSDLESFLTLFPLYLFLTAIQKHFLRTPPLPF